MRPLRLLVLLNLILCSVASAIPTPSKKRALDGVFDPFQTIQPAAPPEAHGEHASEHAAEHTTHPALSTGSVSLADLLTTLGSNSKAQATSSASHSLPTSSLSSTTSSTVSTTPTSTFELHTSAILTPATSSNSYIVPTHSPTPSVGQSINRGSEEWKIIGVAVISFSAVAAILLLAVFFDQWWGFMRDLVWRKKRRDVDHVEELVPDWEKAGWEIRMARDNDRYPSLPPPARAKRVTRDYGELEKAPVENMTGIGSGFATNNLYAPQPIHFNNYGHGLGILTPAPSTRYVEQPLARSTSLMRSNSRAVPPSPATTLVDPYGGIE